MTAEKLYLVWSEGTGLALAVPRSLHAASQAVLMLNLQLTRFMDCLMKNLSGNLQENIEQSPNYSHFCKEWRVAQRCPDDDWHKKLISGALWSLDLLWIGMFYLMWHQSSPFAQLNGTFSADQQLERFEKLLWKLDPNLDPECCLLCAVTSSRVWEKQQELPWLLMMFTSF